MLMHSNALVQRMGLLLSIAVLKRIRRIIGSNTRPAYLNTQLLVDMNTYLPDLELLINARARYLHQFYKHLVFTNLLYSASQSKSYYQNSTPTQLNSTT